MCHVLCYSCAKSRQINYPYTDLGLEEKWKIKRDEIEMKHLLSLDYYYAVVYFGKWRSSIDVAVKTQRKNSTSTRALLLNEAKILKDLSHNHVVVFHGVCFIQRPFLIVYEYMVKGSLLDFLRQDSKTLQFADLVKIASQVASGMEYLETKHLIHRDLTARSVLINEKNIPKICSEFILFVYDI